MEIRGHFHGGLCLCSPCPPPYRVRDLNVWRRDPPPNSGAKFYRRIRIWVCLIQRMEMFPSVEQVISQPWEKFMWIDANGLFTDPQEYDVIQFNVYSAIHTMILFLVLGYFFPDIPIFPVILLEDSAVRRGQADHMLNAVALRVLGQSRQCRILGIHVLEFCCSLKWRGLDC